MISSARAGRHITDEEALALLEAHYQHADQVDDPDCFLPGILAFELGWEVETEGEREQWFRRAQQWFERYSSFSRGFRRKVYDKNQINPLAAGKVGAGANMALRREAWALIARHVDAGKLESMTGEIGLSEVIAFCPSMLEGRVRGRTVVDVNR